MDTGTCKGCAKEIIWFKNENDKAEPFDVRPARVLVNTAEGEKPTTVKAHLPHFVTCAKAENFKKKPAAAAPILGVAKPGGPKPALEGAEVGTVARPGPGRRTGDGNVQKSHG